MVELEMSEMHGAGTRQWSVFYHLLYSDCVISLIDNSSSQKSTTLNTEISIPPSIEL